MAGLKPGQRHSGQFKKGQAANPGGRPKGIFALAKECQKYGMEAVEFVVAVMRNPEVETRDRLRAASELLDRGFGKAKVSTEVTGIEGGPVKLLVEVVRKDDRGANA